MLLKCLTYNVTLNVSKGGILNLHPWTKARLDDQEYPMDLCVLPSVVGTLLHLFCFGANQD